MLKPREGMTRSGGCAIELKGHACNTRGNIPPPPISCDCSKVHTQERCERMDFCRSCPESGLDPIIYVVCERMNAQAPHTHTNTRTQRFACINTPCIRLTSAAVGWCASACAPGDLIKSPLRLTSNRAGIIRRLFAVPLHSIPCTQKYRSWQDGRTHTRTYTCWP